MTMMNVFVHADVRDIMRESPLDKSLQDPDNEGCVDVVLYT